MYGMINGIHHKTEEINLELLDFEVIQCKFTFFDEGLVA